jgi:Cof subfamily protein (haloacid dehalogenase superfamily)
VTDDIPDIRLVAGDMDGTLLDGDGNVPDAFWPLLDDLERAGVLFAPASGRQYQTLVEVFGERPGLVFIAENGTTVVREGVTLAIEPLAPESVAPVVTWARGQAGGGDAGGDAQPAAGLVVCGARSAYIERVDPEFVSHVRRYYAALEVVDDVLAAARHDDVLKLAVYDHGRAEDRTGPAVRALGLDVDVVVSGANWVDVMRRGVNKGRALERLQRELGVTRDQTMAFGDYLNDLELIDAAGWSYAVENAHPLVRERARHLAPANTAGGVLTTVRAVLPHLGR